MDDNEVFIGGWTRPRLREKSQTERHRVWKRARALHSAEGNHLARAIELLGLPYREPEPLPADSDDYARMRERIFSKEGRSAAREATLDGLPAIAGIEDLMHDAVGEVYRRDEAYVITAQALVAELMGELGYADAGTKALPARYVAREGVFWRKA
jgi:hypothetical protein